MFTHSRSFLTRALKTFSNSRSPSQIARGAFGIDSDNKRITTEVFHGTPSTPVTTPMGASSSAVTRTSGSECIAYTLLLPACYDWQNDFSASSKAQDQAFILDLIQSITMTTKITTTATETQTVIDNPVHSEETEKSSNSSTHVALQQSNGRGNIAYALSDFDYRYAQHFGPSPGRQCALVMFLILFYLIPFALTQTIITQASIASTKPIISESSIAITDNSNTTGRNASNCPSSSSATGFLTAEERHQRRQSSCNS